MDFGQEKCEDGLVVHFMRMLLWHSRLLGVYAQDHRFNAEEACRAIYRFFRKCGGRVETLVIDQDSVFVSEEVYGEVFETEAFKAFLSEQELTLWVCNKSDPESKGCVENSVKFVKSSFFSARSLSSIDDVLRSLPRWLERKNRRIHQGTYRVPQAVFEDVEKAALRPLLPSLYEAAPLFLQPVAVNGQPYAIAIPVDRKLLQCHAPVSRDSFNNPKRVFLVCFIIFELVFLFALLSNYPGYCSMDSNDIIKMVLGQSAESDWYRYDGLSNHHPVFYVFCVWAVFTITSPFNNLMFSVAVYIFIQMTYLAFAVSVAVAWLDKAGAPKAFTTSVVALLALSPILCAHAIVLWKDVPFSATMLLLLVSLAQLDFDRKSNIGQIVQLSALLLLAALFRNNGVLVSVAVLIYLIVFYQPAQKACCAIIAGIAVFFVLLNGPLFSALSIQSGHFAESVGIPIQQIAATIQSGANISQEDQETLSSILPLEKWSVSYSPDTSNTIKFLPEFNDGYLDNHKIEFLGAWLHLLPGNLNTYIRAWILETYSYWQPGFTTIIGHPTTVNEGQPLDIPHMGFNPYQFANLLRSNFPILFGTSALIWIAVFLLYLCLVMRKGQRKSLVLLPFIPSLAMYATVLIAAPTLNDYRYVFALYLAIPFLAYLPFVKKMKKC